MTLMRRRFAFGENFTIVPIAGIVAMTSTKDIDHDDTRHHHRRHHRFAAQEA